MGSGQKTQRPENNMIEIRKYLFLAMPVIALGCGSADQTLVHDTASETEVEPSVLEETEIRKSSMYDAEFNAAASEFKVPAAVLKALAYSQTRYEMVTGEAEFEGQSARIGMMALTPEQLQLGATAAGVTVEAASTDVAAHIRAAAAYLGSIATAQNVTSTALQDWASVIGEYSGIEIAEAREAYVREEVFGAIVQGLGSVTDDLEASGQGLTEEDALASVGQGLAGPDYAASIWRPSPNTNARPSGTKVQLVVIHTCEGGYSGCWGWLANSRSGASAHYVVSTGTEISQLVREYNRAWHVGATYNPSYNGGVMSSLSGVSVNHFSIGIEHAGYASQKTFPATQMETSAKLVCNITRDHGIPRDRYHVVAHAKVQPYNRTDPGPNWPWTDYMYRINRACGTTTTTTTFSPIIIDSNNTKNNTARGYIKVSSNWDSSASTPGFYGTGYYFAGTLPVSDGAEFYFYLSANSTRTIDAWWVAGTNRSAGAPFVAFNAQGVKLGTKEVNQTINGGAWRTVGSFAFTKGWNKIVLSRWTGEEGKVVIADAVRVR